MRHFNFFFLPFAFLFPILSILLPIYMYHPVMPRNQPAFEPYLCLTPEILRQQILQLQTHGLRLVTMTQAAQCLGAGRGKPACAVLTFDDMGRNFV